MASLDSASLYDDTSVDNIANSSGVVDQLPVLSLDISDGEIIKNLDRRIEDSKSYWNKTDGFNLEASRNKNERMHVGKQVDTTKLYNFQVPYTENQIFVGEESILAYVTSQAPKPEVAPAQNDDRSKVFAADLEKAMLAHSQHFDIQSLIEVSVRNLLHKRVGLIKFRFDPDYGENGEIVPEAIDPSLVIIDKNAQKGQNPAFICHVLKMSVEEMLGRFPKKKKEIFETLGIVRGTPRQLSEEVAVREVWVTHYDKANKPSEGVVWYFNSLVLDKSKDPNWLHTGKRHNFLPAPTKPFIPLNYINYGTHWIDVTTPLEQAAQMQDVLNKRGRQIVENADKANGLLAISTDAMTKDDAQNLTGDPNQKVMVTTAGTPIDNLITQIPGKELPNFVMSDKLDVRTQIGNIMGTPTDFTGSSADDGDPTLGQVMLKKNQSAGRQDLLVRAIDSFMNRYFNFLVQMMVVYYDEKHMFVYNGGDGEFDYITMSRDLIDDGIAVNVKSGTTLPFDKSRQEAVALNLAKMGMISPLDLFKDLHMDNPQQRYDNWYKWKTDPSQLARDAKDTVDQSDAYVAYVEIMAGGKPEQKKNPTTEYVLSLRKLMINDDFLKAKKKYQTAFIKYVKDCLNSLALRQGLEEMSGEAPAGQELDPGVPIQPPQPMQPPMGAPGMPPQGQLPMPGAMPPAGGMPGTPMGAPAPMTAQGVMSGTPLPNPGAPQGPQLGDVSSLPQM